MPTRTYVPRALHGTAVKSGFLHPSELVADARETHPDDPSCVVTFIAEALRDNEQRSDRDAVFHFIYASKTAAERRRDRTGLGFDYSDEDWYSAVLHAAATAFPGGNWR